VFPLHDVVRYRLVLASTEKPLFNPILWQRLLADVTHFVAQDPSV
jgi:hypothetical protein